MENLLKLRKNNNINQKKLSEYLNCSQTLISKWEKGEREASYEMLIKLATFFNCSIDYLLNHEQQKQPEQVEPNQQLNYIKNFSNTKSNCLEMLAEMSEDQSKLLQSYMQGLLGKEFNYFKN